MPSLRCPFVLALLAALIGCGSGSQSMPASSPVFTSTPPTAANQGVAYNYAITATDPAGGSVTFALSGAPTGAGLSGSTLSWTPVAAQSRVSNSFTVTATSSEGGHATQSWSVTPAGTINGSWIDTRWTASGSSNEPFDWTKHGPPPQALIPQPDGTFTPISGMGNADGTFSIPNVPGGYYWLQIVPLHSSYWTSSSTFDYGRDIVGHAIGTIPTSVITTFDFNIAGLDAVVAGDQFAFLTDWSDNFPVMNIGFAIPSPTGATTMTTSYKTPQSNLDYSTVDMGFLLQYEPVSAGAVTGVALGPELMVSNLSLVSGATDNVNATLNASPHASFDLNVKGSQWAALYENAGPGTVTPVDTYISLAAQPFAPATVLGERLNLPLFLPPLTGNGFGFTVGWPTAAPCVGFVAVNPPATITSYPPILTDQDFGSLAYGDPFDANWARVFSLCQEASVQVPVPGGGTPATFLFEDGVNTAIPTSSVVPLALPVQNPTIDGASFFAAGSGSATGITLSWSAPSGAAPFAYRVAPLIWTTLPNGIQTYLGGVVFYTGKTSMTLSPLQTGQTYVFVITTEVDARANVETSPHRSGLPTAVATVISAPFTTN
jgi:hypothetical protein